MASRWPAARCPLPAARCPVERLMRQIGLRGAVRGKETRATVADKAAPCPADRVNRQFQAPQPNALWLPDFTDVATWQGFVSVSVAFGIDVFARRIVGWRVSRTAQAGFVLDALEQARHDRRPPKGGLIHHSDRGRQYVAIHYTERLLAAGIEPSVGSVGDSYDTARAETGIGLFKTEVIRRRGPWRNMEPSGTPPWSGSTGTTSAPPRADRQHPTRRVRGRMGDRPRKPPHRIASERRSRRRCYQQPSRPTRRRTHLTTEPPSNPARFTARSQARY
jgi:hypothetical protein